MDLVETSDHFVLRADLPGMSGVIGWTALLELTRTCFRAPSFALFTDLLFGWVCAPGRRTITAMIAVARTSA